MELDTGRTREWRSELQSLAKPQAGVDALKDKFPRPTTPIPGVVDTKAAAR